MIGSNDWVIATGWPVVRSWSHARLSGHSSRLMPTCGWSEGSLRMPCHGIASWGTPSGAVS